MFLLCQQSNASNFVFFFNQLFQGNYWTLPSPWPLRQKVWHSNTNNHLPTNILLDSMRSTGLDRQSRQHMPLPVVKTASLRRQFYGCSCQGRSALCAAICFGGRQWWHDCGRIIRQRWQVCVTTSDHHTTCTPTPPPHMGHGFDAYVNVTLVAITAQESRWWWC